MLRLALHPNLFAVRLNDAFCNRQSHTGSLGLEAVPFASEEFVEDARALLLVDARAAVGDTDHDFRTFALRRHRDRRPLGRILKRVLQELPDHLLHKFRVALGKGKTMFERLKENPNLKHVETRALNNGSDLLSCELAK